MANERTERFPDWKKIYETEAVETMPWYKPDLDEDLAAEIKSRNLKKGKFLDIGTGPATQAMNLEKMGFEVTATDLSPSAIGRAKSLNPKINFVVDDILKSNLKGSFDFALDRGCFHVLPPSSRRQYAETLHRLLNPGGLLFLKTFSAKEPDEGFGPYRFKSEDVAAAFAGFFEILSSKESAFTGPSAGSDPEGSRTERKALFSVLKNR